MKIRTGPVTEIDVGRCGIAQSRASVLWRQSSYRPDRQAFAAVALAVAGTLSDHGSHGETRTLPPARRGRRPPWVPVAQVHRCGRSGEPPGPGRVRGCSSGRVTGTAV